MYEYKIKKQEKEGGSSLISKNFDAGVKSIECPNSLLSFHPELKELVELQFQAETSGIQLFGSDQDNRPAWSLDFHQLVVNSENRIHSAHNESLARS